MTGQHPKPASARSYRGASVSVAGVTKSFRAVRAVDDVTVDVAAGEFVALLGPSGSGKTTLFMAIAGFERPDSGRISIDGRDVTTLPAHRRELGIVFQRYALFPHLTVRQNVTYPLRMRGIRRTEQERQSDEALELVDMGRFADRQIDQLSGGQQQRIALARALVFRPPVLLMDEPLGALDRKLREQVQLEIRRLHHELGTTILYVTHDQDEALVMADRLAVMRDGRLLQVGRPHEVYNHPTDAFVAGFLGRTNFLDVTIDTVRECEATVRIGDIALPATVPDGSPVRPGGSGDPAQVSIRPERISLATSGPGLPGRVTEIIFTGSTTSVGVDVGVGSLVVETMTGAAGSRLREGDPVVVSWPPDAAHLFPSDLSA